MDSAPSDTRNLSKLIAYYGSGYQAESLRKEVHSMAVTIEEMREQLLINSESLVRLEGNINTLDTKLNGKVELLDEKIKTLTDRIDTVVKNTSDGKNTRRTWSIALIAAAPGILMIIIEIIKLFNPG